MTTSIAGERDRGLKCDEAGAILGVGAITVRKMLRSGTLHGYKVGTQGEHAQWRVLESEVMRYIGKGVADD